MNPSPPLRRTTLSLIFLLGTCLSALASAGTTIHTTGFETGLEGWTPVKETSLYDWARHSHGTTSRYTGPAGAHEGEYYLYLETSYGNTPGKIAYLESPAFSGENILEVTFHYHLYGNQMGRLLLQTFDGEAWKNFWQIEGQQHDSTNAAWTEKTLDLSGQGAQQIRFVGVTGTGYKGDMAIDYIVLKTGEPAAPGSNSPWTQSGSDIHYEHPDGGNVGIGTDTPSADLHILGNLSQPLTGVVSIAADTTQVTGTGTAFTEELSEGDSLLIGGRTFLVTEITSDTALTVDASHAQGAEQVTAYTDSDLLSIQTGAEEQALVVNRAGKVGIGTAAPVARLDVAGGIRLGYDAICDQEREGTIRYDNAGQAVEFCDGVVWTVASGGEDGKGKSAYEIWLDAGNTGSEGDFIASLRGEKGDIGAQGSQGEQGAQGEPGSTGAQGPPGIAGQDGADGTDGKSAYEIWLEAGNTGSEAEFIAALKGEKGDPGETGPQGEQGEFGSAGMAPYSLIKRFTCSSPRVDQQDIDLGLDDTNASFLVAMVFSSHVGASTDHVTHLFGRSILVSSGAWSYEDGTQQGYYNEDEADSNGYVGITHNGNAAGSDWYGNHEFLIIPLKDNHRMDVRLCDGYSSGTHKIKLRAIGYFE